MEISQQRDTAGGVPRHAREAENSPSFQISNNMCVKLSGTHNRPNQPQQKHHHIFQHLRTINLRLSFPQTHKNHSLFIFTFAADQI